MDESQEVKIGKLEIKVGDHESRLNKIDIILDKVRNRPPVWATVVIGILLAAIGYLAKGN